MSAKPKVDLRSCALMCTACAPCLNKARTEGRRRRQTSYQLKSRCRILLSLPRTRGPLAGP
eukprot:1213419-Prymnesium_polylepis.1